MGNQPTTSALQQPADKRPAVLLVIQSDQYDWPAIFGGCCLEDGRAIQVVQCGWHEMLVAADSPHTPPEYRLTVHLMKGRTVKPDFILCRNECRGATHTEDHRNALFGLMYGRVPSVNSLHSIYMFLERPVVQAELNGIMNRLGEAQFPLISQSYYSSFREMMYGNSFPAVVKVGHAHAGAGKMKVANHHDWEDFRSVMMMTDGKYCSAEPFVEGECDLRIQKIGASYRVFRRTAVSGNWKTNTGTSMIEEIELLPRYKRWADEASSIFNGLDICTVDVICGCDGKEYILEVNGTSSGLSPDCADEDNCLIRDLTLEKMNAHLRSVLTCDNA